MSGSLFIFFIYYGRIVNDLKKYIIPVENYISLGATS